MFLYLDFADFMATCRTGPGQCLMKHLQQASENFEKNYIDLSLKKNILSPRTCKKNYLHKTLLQAPKISGPALATWNKIFSENILGIDVCFGF